VGVEQTLLSKLSNVSALVYFLHRATVQISFPAVMHPLPVFVNTLTHTQTHTHTLSHIYNTPTHSHSTHTHACTDIYRCGRKADGGGRAVTAGSYIVTASSYMHDTP